MKNKILTVLIAGAFIIAVLNVAALAGGLPEPDINEASDIPPIFRGLLIVPDKPQPLPSVTEEPAEEGVAEETQPQPLPEPQLITDELLSGSLYSVFSKNRVVSAQVAVITDGNVTYHYEYGIMSKQTKELATEKTKYRVASLTKVVTTMTAMTLVDGGRLSLDEDLSDVFGYTVRNKSYTKIPITVRMLMSHTSSLNDISPNYAGTVKGQLASGTHFGGYKPGTRFAYCNFGMGILGAAIEAASGEKLYEYSEETLFRPMGVDASYLASRLEDTEQIADCYFHSTLDISREQLLARKADDPVGDTDHLGAGALVISACDYGRLLTVLINDGVYDGKVYLSPEAVEEMETPVIATAEFDQCLALRTASTVIKGHKIYYHNGNANGILSFGCYDPEQRSGVVVITSGSHSEFVDGAYEVCLDAARLCYTNIIDSD